MGQNYAVLGKTASFWESPKRRSFGVKGSVGIYIYFYIPIIPLKGCKREKLEVQGGYLRVFSYRGVLCKSVEVPGGGGE
jgi:hypothetical protein